VAKWPIELSISSGTATPGAISVLNFWAFAVAVNAAANMADNRSFLSVIGTSSPEELRAALPQTSERESPRASAKMALLKRYCACREMHFFVEGDLGEDGTVEIR
jgi:hypothetical protein